MTFTIANSTENLIVANPASPLGFHPLTSSQPAATAQHSLSICRLPSHVCVACDVGSTWYHHQGRWGKAAVEVINVHPPSSRSSAEPRVL